jgi:mono/diheme cytochrome c family protein
MKKTDLKYIFILVFLALFLDSCEVKTYEHGEILYNNFCANCHMEDGTGLVGVIPPLAGADYLGLHPEKLPCIINKGIKGEIIVNGRKYNTEMVGIPRLTEFEITNVINYINTAWGNDFEIVKHMDVRKALEACE